MLNMKAVILTLNKTIYEKHEPELRKIKPQLLLAIFSFLFIFPTNGLHLVYHS